MGETEGTGASATVQGFGGEGSLAEDSRSLDPAAVLALADIV